MNTKNGMKKGIFIVAVTMTASYSFAQKSTSTESNKKYLVFKVTNSVIDCPHFGTIIPDAAQKNLHLTLIEKNEKKKMMLFEWTKPYDLSADQISNKFKNMLDSLRFPSDLIDQIYISDKRE